MAIAGLYRQSRRGLLGGGAALLLSPTIEHGGAARAAPPLPVVSPPLPDSETRGVYVFDVSRQGYLAQEVFLSGRADVYASVDMADAADTNARDSLSDLGKREFRRTLLQAAQPYVTRLILYRPADPARFSGNVVIESMHPEQGGVGTVWGPMNAVFLRRGDAYVLVQHPVTIEGLKRFLPERYGKLASVHPTQIWGMLRDTALAAKTGLLFPGLQPRRAYLTGYSWTGVATATFANYHHDQVRLPSGRPLYDGYMPMANATYVRPLDVPVVRMNTQSDFDSFGGLANRSPDSDDASGRYRLYEVAGAAHVRAPFPLPGSADPPRFSGKPASPGGLPAFDTKACYDAFPAGSRMNDMPFALAAAAMVSNLSAWVDEGRPPPHAPRIETAPDGATATDADGNARGGLRLPEMQVPAAVFGVGRGGCNLFGYTLDFGREGMSRRYGDRPAYLQRFRAAADAAVADRLLLAEDRPLLLARAEAQASV